MRLKKLSAALAVISLSLVSLVAVATPALAVPTASASPDSFSPSSTTQAFTLTIPSTGASISAFSDISVRIEDSSFVKWPLSGTCPLSPARGTLADCKIASVSVGGSPVGDAIAYAMGGRIYIARPMSGGNPQNFTNSTSNEVIIEFQLGAFTAPATAGSIYQAKVTYNGSPPQTITPAPISVTATPSYTVTFDANGGTGSIAQQTQNAATNLTLNNNQITRTGYTFGGWAASSGSTTVAYADGASYPFTTSTTLYAIWTANSGPAPDPNNTSSGTASGSVVLNLAVGQPIAGAPVDLNVTGMQANAAWDATVRSTPISIGAGNVSSSGSLTQTVNLPSNLEAGWHSITFTSTDANGNPFTTTSYFQVSASGTLVATSSTLAVTGADMLIPFGSAAAMLLIGAALMVIRRRRAV